MESGRRPPGRRGGGTGGSGGAYRVGVTLSDADDTLRSQLKLADGEGLIVTDVVPDGPAAAAGIQKHDVLIKLDGKRISTIEKINAQIQELKDRPATLAFLVAVKRRVAMSRRG